jgi:hypothetical protein
MKLVLRDLTLVALVFCLVPAFDTLSAQPDSQLPDGKQFEFWERPFTASRTYYVDGTKGSDDNVGTLDRPFKTINKAAQILQPGERVVIAEGVYRERVDPARGGSGPEKLISYEAAPGANVVIPAPSFFRGWSRPMDSPCADLAAEVRRCTKPSSMARGSAATIRSAC